MMMALAMAACFLGPTTNTCSTANNKKRFAATLNLAVTEGRAGEALRDTGGQAGETRTMEGEHTLSEEVKTHGSDSTRIGRGTTAPCVGAKKKN